jgi:hypothetical protein
VETPAGLEEKETEVPSTAIAPHDATPPVQESVIVSVRIDEIRGCIEQAADHLKRRRYANAVGLIRQGERCHRETYAVLENEGGQADRQTLDLLHMELRLLNQRLRRELGL